MDFLIREVAPMDAYDVATVHVHSWQAAYRNIIPDEYLLRLNVEKSAERFAKDFIIYKGKTYYYAAELKGKIIGNLAVSKCRDDDKPDAGEIIGIYLLPSYWGMGYGRKMMEFGINKLHELGYSYCCLWVLENNIRARKFYEKYGFIFDGTKKEINLGRPLVEIRYMLSLSK
ncbi:MAG: GNAT family N-acetyltransferase [Methanobacterium sp.]|jgi:ribosomal protein S18 acetylase RimI-like enzyme|uniref:N-acetyltransferase family protein n=1 Tax=Methanobacterium sp. TaxID=2164 RepID=UPI003D927D1C